MKLRCYECRGQFGLARQHFKGRSFCSSKCLQDWQLGIDAEVLRLRNLSDFKPPDQYELPLQKPPEVNVC